MEAASFVFTCSYNHAIVSGLCHEQGIEIKGDLHRLFNQHIKAMARLFLPRINSMLIDRLDLKLCPEGNPLLVFYTRTLRYSKYNEDYLVIIPGLYTKLPVILEIKSQSPHYTLELETLEKPA